MKISYSVVLPYIRDDRRPWLEGVIEAHHDGKRVGYLKFEWISSLLIDKMFPTVWHYANEMVGWCLWLRRDAATIDMSSPETIKKVLQGVRRYSWKYQYYNDPEPRGMSVEEMKKQLVEITRERGIYKRFEEFKTSVDYVYVGYSFVDDGFRFPPEESETNYQRRGIGTTLYQLAAMWLATNMEMPLHSSTLIKPCAVGVWNKMIDLGYPIITVKRPETNKQVNELDYTKTPALLAAAQKTMSGLPMHKSAEFPTADLRKSCALI